MFVDRERPENTQPLEWLRRGNPQARPLVRPANHQDPYYEAGCHPDIVEVMWERINGRLAKDSRCLVYGTPCLVQPVSGVILVVGMGTQYCLRVLPEFVDAARALGCTPVHTWSGSEQQTDLRQELGEGWIFGAFDARSYEWCVATYRQFDTPPPSVNSIHDSMN